MSATQGQLSGDNGVHLPPIQDFHLSSRQLQTLPPSGIMGAAERSEKGSNLGVMRPPSLEQHPGGLRPVFSSRQHTPQLPTPQSPNNIGQYVVGAPYSPESPVPNGPHASYPSSFLEQRISSQRSRETPMEGHLGAQQTMTPDSSPHFPRVTPRYSPIPRMKEASSSRASIKIEGPVTMLAPPPHILSPISSPSLDHRSRTSRFSSPFMAKLSMADRNAKTRSPIGSRPQSYSPDPRPTEVNDVFLSSPFTAPLSSPDHINRSGAASVSTPPTSPPPSQLSLLPLVGAGGEMERIRQDTLAHFQEAETRRPEYLKRAKRTLTEADPTNVDDESARERERGAAVGITESPNKGRRLKLFQETSEESFEESLMAGGYGRYRTADWVRQPQPIALTTPGPAGPSNIVSLLEEAEEAEPTERELKKRKRLAAFRGEGLAYQGSGMKLHPVELEGRGRVLLDLPREEEVAPEPTPTKKRGGNRRKKKGSELTAKEKKALAVAAASEEFLERPNWPDAEFPWRVRTEEREELARVEEEEKMRVIERFLDRNSDDEDSEDSRHGGEGSSPEWGFYEDDPDRPASLRRGRGKTVLMPANTIGMKRGPGGRQNAFFQAGPADARSALLLKKSVRTLSYRRQRRRRATEEDSDEEAVCICNGKDDGRELVQCDGCHTWYHLQCIGIRNIAELGKEEDPWFCENCMTRSRGFSTEDLSSEPIFVPTEEPRASQSYDAPFFQPPQDSPMTWEPRLLRTPPRSVGKDNVSSVASAPSWVGSSEHGPSTPQYPSQGVRVYVENMSGYGVDESPFDPTSTPSRGIRFGAPFITPKENLWTTRGPGLPRTPPRASERGSPGKVFGGPGSLTSVLDDGGGYAAYGRISYDESPIRRTKSGGEGPKGRRGLESRSYGAPELEESPVMRTKGKERRRD